jgi:C-terminal processing protease CtpA/Prc
MQLRALFPLAAFIGFTGLQLAAADTTINRELGVSMLRWGKETVLREHCDPTLNGIDLKARCELAEQKIAKASSDSEVLRIVAQAFLDLGDKGSRLLPPPLAMTFDYGWSAMVVGDACFVSRLTKDSDAVGKGLKLGDRIESINGVAANRATLSTLLYFFEEIDPQGALRVVAVSADGTRRTLELQTQVTHRSRTRASVMSAEYRQQVLKKEEDRARSDDQFVEVGDALVWRSRHLSGLSKGLNRLRKAKKVVIDFRGNSTGTEDDLRDLLAAFFDHEISAGTVQQRDRQVPVVSKPDAKPYGGMVIMLVDAHTGKVPEIFARVLQLEDRGIVVGDRTAGEMRWSKAFYSDGDEKTPVHYGMEVTVARMQLRDGKSYEGTGLTPDLSVRPTPVDIAQRSDPALAKALAQVGSKLSPEEAGKLLPSTASSRDL